MRPDEETISAVLGGRAPRDTELGNSQATLILRSIPLRPAGEHTGGLVLLRDVTALQAPRPGAGDEGRHHPGDPPPGEEQPPDRGGAASPAGATDGDPRGPGRARGGRTARGRDRRRPRDAEPDLRRDRGLRRRDRPADPAGHRRRAPREATIRARRTGSFGSISSDAATPLAMVFTELIQNAVEHAFDEERRRADRDPVRARRRRAAAHGRGRRRRAATGLQPRRDHQPGPVDRQHAGGRARR